MLYVDTRWDGNHGIGRFSREVVSRLDIPWSALGGTVAPSSPRDVINPQRMQLTSRDVLYSPGYNAGLTRARQILTLHDIIHLEVKSESSAAKRAYYERVVRPAVRRAGMVLTVSQTSQSALERWLGDSSVDVINVGNGCSAAFTVSGPRSSDYDDFFVYVGNLKAHKNVDVLFNALRLVPQYSLVVISQDQEEVRRRASEAGVGGQVFSLADVTDAGLAAIYRSAKGLLLPSLLEGFGLPAVEALSCGIPVAYWEGCASVAEIVGSAGPSVKDARSDVAWASAMRAMTCETYSMPTRLYNWQNVASQVSTALSQESGVV